ncbi:MAG: hypothetical protein HYZ20_00295 [Burkholderiales bacterium]|nr:hypothetical protein [Burkholderiales bacterium]
MPRSPRVTAASALKFVETAELPRRPATRRRGGATPAAAPAPAPVLDETRAQAAVVGGELLSFAPGVGADWRQDLMHSSLLAQLVARRKVPDAERLFDWYDAYFDTLAQIGWAVHDRSFSVYVESGQRFSAHEAILKVAATLLGPAPATLALVTSTLEALRGMEADSPWMTLFDRETRHARSARFQVGAVEPTAGGALEVALMAFALEARSTLTQVLFFKGVASDVTLRHSAARVAIDTGVLAGVRDALRAKLVGHANAFVRQLPDF